VVRVSYLSWSVSVDRYTLFVDDRLDYPPSQVDDITNQGGPTVTVKGISEMAKPQEARAVRLAAWRARKRREWRIERELVADWLAAMERAA
jgi:hypothetical protein